MNNTDDELSFGDSEPAPSWAPTDREREALRLRLISAFEQAERPMRDLACVLGDIGLGPLRLSFDKHEIRLPAESMAEMLFGIVDNLAHFERRLAEEAVDG